MSSSWSFKAARAASRASESLDELDDDAVAEDEVSVARTAADEEDLGGLPSRRERQSR